MKLMSRVRQKPQNRKTKPNQTANGLGFGAGFGNRNGFWFLGQKPQWFLGPQWFGKQCKLSGSLSLYILCNFTLFLRVFNIQ